MAEEIKKVISIDTKGAESVKDLIDKVEKLRGILKTLDETSDEYKTTLGELKSAQDSLSSSLGENKTKAEAAEGSYNALAQQMKVLKKEWKATSDEAERNALGKEIKGINDQLKTLDQSIGNNQRNVGNYAGSFQSLKQEIREARDIMAGAARGSDEYAAAAKRAADAADQLKDMQMEISNGASGLDNKFSVMTNMLGSVSGGFAAVQGAMALFGAESENLQKTFVKLQAAMSMTQGLKALAELPKGLNAAKIAFGGVTTGVKNFIKSLNLVKGAIAATGIGLLLVLLGELIANWDAVTEAVSNFVGGMDGLTEKLAGVANVIKNFITGPIKALGLAFKGQFSEAWEAFKDGFKISANYVEGRQAQVVKNVQKAEQKKREEYDKTKDDYIKDMEAQYGADWKYTKDGQKAYREYFNNKLSMYKKDSEEYKKAQRDMWSYERELKEQSGKGSGKSGGSSKTKTGKSEADKAAEEAAKWREELEEAQKKGRDAMNELLSDAYQKRLKAYRDSIVEVGQGIQKAFEVEPLLRRNNEVLSQAEGILGKYSADIAKAYDYNIGQAQIFYDALKDKNRVVLDSELEMLAKKLPEDVFNTVRKATDTIMKGTGAALDEYTQLIIKGVGNLTEEEKKTFDIYKKLIAESARIGNISAADIMGYYDSVIKLTKDFEAEEKKFEKTQEALLKQMEEHLKEAAYEALEIDEELRYQIETLLKEGGFDRIPTKLEEAIAESAPKLYKFIEEVRNRANITYESIIGQIAMYKQILSSTLSDADKMSELSAQNEVQNIAKRQKFWSSVFDWKSQEDRNRFDDEIKYNNQMLIYETERINSQIKQKEIEKELYEEGSTERAQLATEIAQLEIEQSNLVTETVLKNEDIQMEKYRLVADGRRKLVEKTAETIGNVGNFLMNQSDALTKKYKKDGEWQNKEKEKQAEKMFNVGKALAISEAVVSTYQGAQEAFTSLASIPYVGPALGIAAAAAAVTAGMLRIQSIASQKFGDDGNVSDASSSVGITSAVAVPQLESTPYSYTSTITDAKDEDELNKPVIVKVVDIEDAMKVQESRQVETSF